MKTLSGLTTKGRWSKEEVSKVTHFSNFKVVFNIQRPRDVVNFNISFTLKFIDRDGSQGVILTLNPHKLNQVNQMGRIKSLHSRLQQLREAFPNKEDINKLIVEANVILKSQGVSLLTSIDTKMVSHLLS